MMKKRKLVLASHNEGKLSELKDLLTGTSYDIVSLKGFALNPPAETGSTFVENAIIKAKYVASHTGLPALADDSGLCVDYLNGEPGVHSARYAGDNRDEKACIDKLLNLMKNVPDEKRQACFHCVLVYLRHAADPDPIIAQGRWQGRILQSPTGDKGFGYDPIFYVPEKNCSAGELHWQEKNWISHRGQAMKLLLMALTQNA